MKGCVRPAPSTRVFVIIHPKIQMDATPSFGVSMNRKRLLFFSLLYHGLCCNKRCGDTTIRELIFPKEKKNMHNHMIRKITFWAGDIQL